MRKVLVACKDMEEANRLKAGLEPSYDVYTVTSSDMLTEGMTMFDAALIDHGFVNNGATDFLEKVLSASHIPVLMLAPPEDQKCAIEAIRAGAFNYVVKLGHYEDVLSIAIEEAITRFNKQEQTKATITALKAKIASLEEILGKIPQDVIDNVRKDARNDTPSDSSSDIVNEIVNRFRQGEINLPSMPQINVKFQELVSRGADYRQISDLLKQDLAITSKLIMVSNSAMYRGMETNKTLEQAVSRLGMGVTEQYVNIIGNRALYTISQKKYVPLIDQLWRHSISCAYACQAVAKIVAPKTTFDEDPFILGLLHDIGKLILLQVISELETKGKFNPEVYIQKVMNITEAYHGQFGSALLKRWQFSKGFTDVALYHDNLDEADPISKSLLVVHFANLLVKNLGFNSGNENSPSPNIDVAESKHLLKLDEENIAAVKKETVEYMDSVGRIFS